jgi:hypothetical protein
MKREVDHFKKLGSSNNLYHDSKVKNPDVNQPFGSRAEVHANGASVNQVTTCRLWSLDMPTGC